MIDWKKVAAERWRELKRREANMELLRLQLQQELYRALLMRFHAMCLSRPGKLADEVSVAVAAKITEGLRHGKIN